MFLTFEDCRGPNPEIAIKQLPGLTPSTIAAVVGHQEGREGITLKVYSWGPSDDQMRACVGAVSLPKREGRR